MNSTSTYKQPTEQVVPTLEQAQPAKPKTIEEVLAAQYLNDYLFNLTKIPELTIAWKRAESILQLWEESGREGRNESLDNPIYPPFYVDLFLKEEDDLCFVSALFTERVEEQIIGKEFTTAGIEDYGPYYTYFLPEYTEIKLRFFPPSEGTCHIIPKKKLVETTTGYDIVYQGEHS